MIYELMDVESANLVGTYETEAAALAVVRAAIREHGPHYVEAFALGTSDEEGEGEQIAAGAALAARVLAAAPEPEPRSA